jgi:hypothetical protein
VPKKRVYELARQFELTSAALGELLKRKGLPAKHHLSALEAGQVEQAQKLWQRIKSGTEPLVFLAYSSKDIDFMHRLRGDLEEADLTIWTAESIKPGTPTWTEAIQDAITRSRCVVVVISKSALESTWVRKEALYALQRHKRIFLVLATDEMPDPPPLEYVGIQVTDARGGRYSKAVRDLISALREYLT